MNRIVLAAGCLAVLGMAVLRGQTGVTIESAFAKETVVRGTAPAGSGPIRIVNVHFPARVTVGLGPVSREGTFGIAVKAPLVAGHRLVALDAAGRTSPVFVVAPARSADTPAPPAR